MNKMQRLRSLTLFVASLCMCFNSISAHDFKVDNICYAINADGEAVSVTYDSDADYWDRTSCYVGDVVIPAQVTYGGKTYAVTSLGTSAFENCLTITSVSIPESVTTIHDRVFMNTSLTSVFLPKSITSYHSNCFSNSQNLTAINVDADNPYYTSINGIVYSKDLTELVSVPCGFTGELVIPDGVTSIGRETFAFGAQVTSVVLPATLTQIDLFSQPFHNCPKLEKIKVLSSNPVFTSVNGALYNKAMTSLLSVPRATTGTFTVPNGVETIGRYAMTYCYDITDIILPNRLKTIMVDACSYTGITSIDIPEGVESIGIDAFQKCANLTTARIPKTVRELYSRSFEGCPNLTSVVIDPANPYMVLDDGMLYNIERTELIACLWPFQKDTVVVPEGVKSLRDEAFCYCTRIKHLEIPEGVESVGVWAFWAMQGLQSIVLPSTLTSAGSGAFRIGSQLKEVYSWSKDPVMVPEDRFGGNDFTLYIPKGSLENYAAKGWTAYANKVVELEDEHAGENIEIEVTDVSTLPDAVYVEPVTALVGNEVEVNICLKNAQQATAYVFDIVLPDGITIAKDANDKYIDALSDRHDDHTRTFNYRGDNVYAFSTLSGNSEPLAGNDGPIRIVKLKIADDVAAGDYRILIKNASYSKLDGTLVTMPDTDSKITVEDYLMGDANGNGIMDIGDAVSIVNYLVGKPSQNFVEVASDMNNNGLTDIGDAVTIVNTLVGKGANAAASRQATETMREPQ